MKVAAKTLQHKRDEQELHEKLVPWYQRRYQPRFPRIYHSYWNEQQLKFLPQRKNFAVLDCGCGTGVLLPDLATRFDWVIGLDLSRAMLREASAHNSQTAELALGDAEELPFMSGVFDVVVMRGALHHLDNPEEALTEANRILKPSGVLAISEPSADSLVLRLPRRLLVPKSYRFSPSHRALSSSYLREMMKEASLVVERSARFGFVGFPLCGFSDLLPVLRFLPFSAAIACFLIAVDRLLAAIPLIRRQSWHIMLWAHKS